MDGIPSREEKTLQLLLKQELITEAQGKRLRGRMRRGMSLAEAISKTPLVDPVKLASIQSLAAHSENQEQPQEPIRRESSREIPRMHTGASEQKPESTIETPNASSRRQSSSASAQVAKLAEEETAPPVSGAPSPASAAETDSNLSELDEIDFPGLADERIDLDLDDLDMEETDVQTEGGPGMLAGPRPASSEDDIDTLRMHAPDALKNAGKEEGKDEDFAGEVDLVIEEVFDKKEKKQKGFAPLKPEEAITDFSTDVLPALGNRENYQPRAGVAVQTFDLEDDEGINLIQQVNEILTTSFREGDAGLIIDPGQDPAVLKRYGNSRRLSSEEVMETDMVEKIVNRLKVMGRIEPWRRQATQKGVFRIRHRGKEASAFVQSDPGSESPDLLVIQIERES